MTGHKQPYNTNSTQPTLTEYEARQRAAVTAARSILSLFWALAYLWWGVEKP